MTNKQFKFSLMVGCLLIILGAIVIIQAHIGIALLGLGIGILLLATLTRNTEQKDTNMSLTSTSLEQSPQALMVDSPNGSN